MYSLKTNLFYSIFLTLSLAGCTTSSINNKKFSDDSSFEDDGDDDSDLRMSSSTGFFEQSITNNRDTSLVYSEVKAAEYAQSLAPSLAKLKGRNKMLTANALLASYQLSSAGMNDMLKVARTFALERMRINIDANLPEQALLNLALGAVKKRKYALAENYLDVLLKSKNSKILSSAYTVAGTLDLISNRVPEAVLDWKKAVKVNSRNNAAKLNLGFVALKYGRYDDAKKYLSSMQNDWFALSGLSVAAFMLGDVSAAENYCKRSISANSKNKMSLFNCGIQSFIAKGDVDRSRKMLQGALKAPGSTKIDEKIYAYLEKMERAVMERQRSAAIQKAKAAAAERAAKQKARAANLQKSTPKSSAAKNPAAKPSAPKAVEGSMENAFDDEE